MSTNRKMLLIAVIFLQITFVALIMLWVQDAFKSSIRTESSRRENDPKPNCLFNISAGGRINVLRDGISMNDVELLLADRGISAGGFWCPRECNSSFKVAILIPFRNRDAQLPIFLRHIHPFLQNQMLEYAIYVVQQTSRARFNRGTLFNIGYVESNKRHHWQCHINHDVDLLPEDSRNYYSCPEGNPRHMISAYDRFGYKLVYETNFGGVTAFTTSQFHDVNGYSNKFFGWGGEDDDLWNRAVAKGYKPVRYPSEIGRYSSLKHGQEEMSPDRMNLVRYGPERFATDGLNTLNYNISEVQVKSLYTKFIVDIL